MTPTRTREQDRAPAPRVQEVSIRPLVVRVPETTRETTYIERSTFVERESEREAYERHTDKLPVVTSPPAQAPDTKVVVITQPERSVNEPPVREQGTPDGNTRPTYPGRTDDRETDIPTVVIPPAAEQKSTPPRDALEVKPEVKHEPVSPTPKVEVKKEEKRSNGKPGRKNTELQHAVNWILWERTGFDKKRCPWRNPYECKKHQPPDENLIEARRLLGFDF